MTDKYTVSRKVAFLWHQLKQDDLRFSSMEDYESSSSSSGEEELQLLSAQHKVQTSQKISKQLQYYNRRTKDKQKRKYTPLTDQENQSRQLKRYHATKANSSNISMDPAASETTSDNWDKCMQWRFSSSRLRWWHYPRCHTFYGESEESSLLSEGDSSRSSESEDFEESEEVNLQQENETSQSQEEPLYQGTKISKILSFVLIVSFVWHTFADKNSWK